MNRGKARSILFSALLLVSALTIIISNYGAVSIDVKALIPLAPANCLITFATTTVTNPSGPPLAPDVELSQWSGPPGTPVGVTGCAFDTTDLGCKITSPSSPFIATNPAPACSIAAPNGIVFGSFTVTGPATTPATPAAPGLYVVTVTGCTDLACTTPKDSASVLFSVAFVSTTVSTSTSTTTTVISTSYSTLTTSTNFFSTLTTTTISSIGRSTETDFFVTLVTVTAALSTLLTTISQTLTTSITTLSTTFTTETDVVTSPLTTSALVVGPLQNFYPDGLAVLAVLLLAGWLVLRRIIT